jgi:hypothetical protein
MVPPPSDRTLTAACQSGVSVLRFSVGAEHFGAPRGSRDATLALLGADVARDAQGRWLYPVESDAVFKLD